MTQAILVEAAVRQARYGGHYSQRYCQAVIALDKKMAV
jgi:phage-related protein